MKFLFPRIFLPVLAMVLLLAGPARADFDSALAAYNSQDFQTALGEFLTLANQGDANSQAILALMYIEGQAVDVDMAEALRWYTASAEQGQVDSQYALAIIAMEGVGGVTPDMDTARAWMREAARRGHMYAQFDLGNLYANGLGVDQSDEEAARWFAMAAEQGHMDAQYNLGVMYLSARGVELNGETALEWFERAGEKATLPPNTIWESPTLAVRSLSPTLPKQKAGCGAVQLAATPMRKLPLA